MEKTIFQNLQQTLLHFKGRTTKLSKQAGALMKQVWMKN